MTVLGHLGKDAFRPWVRSVICNPFAVLEPPHATVTGHPHAADSACGKSLDPETSFARLVPLRGEFSIFPNRQLFIRADP